jgi:hypothetical protein
LRTILLAAVQILAEIATKPCDYRTPEWTCTGNHPRPWPKSLSWRYWVSPQVPIIIEMAGRLEARFWVKSRAKVTLQSNPERAAECILLDISATGIGLVTKESLPVNEIMVLETEQHLMLAKVRHCEPRGDGFSVGAERIHAVSKLADASESSKSEQRRMLIQQLESSALAENLDDPLAEPDLAGRSSAVSEELVQSNRQSQEVAKLLESVQLPPTAPIEPSDSGLNPPQVQLPIETPHPSQQALEAPKCQRTTLPAQTQQEPVESDKTDAEGIRSRPSTRSRRISLGIAATVVAGLLVFSLHQNSAKPDHSLPSLGVEKSTQSDPAKGPEKTPVSPPIAKELSPRSELSSTEVETASPNPVQPARGNYSGPRRAVIRAGEPSWLSVSSDGKQTFEGLLTANETIAVEFSQEAVVRIGNAGGVEVSLNGKSIGALGEHGKFRILRLGPSSFRFMPGKD